METPAQQSNIYSMINYLRANSDLFVPLFLICTIISSLGLNRIIKYCVTRGSDSVAVESGVNPAAKLFNEGLGTKALEAFPVVKYVTGLKLSGLDIACVICLSEFTAGECLRVIPKCNHGFHTHCIDTWLGSHSSCPTCRHCLIESNQMRDRFSQAESLPAVQETMNIQVN